ncbi:MAG: sigma-70 family RNA polymerase sigma factor [Acidobacteria bacterium]|nr:sigma-70 family RNA polymerase sigma factor [Acidobacteriota bacterium]
MTGVSEARGETAPRAAPEDAALVARHLAGDPHAFGEIVARYERQVWAVALRMCGEPEDARDVAQETFVSAMRGLRAFRADARLSTWLHRIAVNASLDLLRRRGRRETRALDDVCDRPDPGPGPEESAERAERAGAVRAALARLSPDHRATIVLHDLEQLGYSEIAGVLGIPLGTVKSRIHRARLELAGMLGYLDRSEPGEEGSPLT